MTISFDDTLITGNETIDAQHKELIERIRQFVDSCENENGKVKAIKMLDYLAEYTNFHFSEEEKLPITKSRGNVVEGETLKIEFHGES